MAIDTTSGSGKSLFCNLVNKYPQNIVEVNFNEKIPIDFEKNEKGEILHDREGKPIYRYERVDDWAVQRLKSIFYNKKIRCLCDYKLDTQFNGVISMKSGQKILYKYKTVNHIYQAFQVFAIADWQTEFAKLTEIKSQKPAMGSW